MKKFHLMSLQQKEIRVALVGCGAIAQTHARALMDIRRANCTALFDLEPARADFLRRSFFPTARVIGDLEEVVAHADAAIVAVPNVHHATVSVKLLQAGVHVLCEKPLAISRVEAEEMAEAARETGRVLACGFVRRFFGSTELVSDALRRHLLGEPLRFEVHESIWNWPLNRATFDRQVAGGGVLIDLGPHIFDLLATWFGPLEVREYFDDTRGGVETAALAKVTCATGHGPLTGSIYLTRAFRTPNRARIVCDNGHIDVDPHERSQIQIAFGNDEKPYITTAGVPAFDPFVKQLENFLAAIAGEAQLIAPAEAGVAAAAAIECCYARRKPYLEPWAITASAAVRAFDYPYKKILVTGVAGSVGSRLVEMWADQNRLSELRCMVRSYRTAARIMRYPLEIVEADLTDKVAVKRAAEGCDAVVHLGVGEKAGQETQVLLEASRELGIKRFVHMSTAAVYGRSLPARIEALQERTDIKRTGEPYADEKAKAERAVMRECSLGLEGVILRPHIVYGPYLRWSAELTELLLRNEICVLEDGGWCNLIYIDDLVEAIKCALITGRGFGEPLFITDGAPLKWSEYIAAHASLIGAHPKRKRREDIAYPRLTARGWVRESVRPLFPIIKSRDFRAFVMESPAMRATVFRVYLALRGKPIFRPYLERIRDGASAADSNAADNKGFSEMWTMLQVSEARLSSERAAALIGFRPRVGFAEGLHRTTTWLERYSLATVGLSSESSPSEAFLVQTS